MSDEIDVFRKTAPVDNEVKRHDEKDIQVGPANEFDTVPAAEEAEVAK
jgi:hypothetical protein